MALEDELDEFIEEYVEQSIQAVLEAAIEVYNEKLPEAEAKKIEESLSAGGETYIKIQQTIIANAQAWYDKYPSPPRKYKRRGTLTNPDNIKISASVTTDGSISLGIAHNSDQAEWVEAGFWIYRRDGKFFREGLDFVENIDEEHMGEIDASLSQEEVNQLFSEAFDAVI